jgi:hypothetical protein
VAFLIVISPSSAGERQGHGSSLRPGSTIVLALLIDHAHKKAADILNGLRSASTITRLKAP